MREHLGDGVAVLPLQVAQEPASLADHLEPLGVLDDRLGRDPQVVRDLGELGLQPLHPLGQLLVRSPRAERRRRRRRPHRHRPPVDRVVRGDQRGPVLFGALERGFLAFEGGFLVRVREPRALDLVDLVAEQRELADAGALVPAELFQRAVDGPELLTRADWYSAQRFERRGPGERVQHRALHRGCQQALVRVLAVQVDEAGPELGQLGDRRPCDRRRRRGCGPRPGAPGRRRPPRRSSGPRTGPRPGPRPHRDARAWRRPGRPRAARAPRRRGSCRRRSRR